jgi:hypothetical protein
MIRSRLYMEPNMWGINIFSHYVAISTSFLKVVIWIWKICWMGGLVLAFCYNVLHISSLYIVATYYEYEVFLSIWQRWRLKWVSLYLPSSLQ